MIQEGTVPEKSPVSDCTRAKQDGSVTPAAKCLAGLIKRGVSNESAWAWTYTWFSRRAKQGDARYAVMGADGVWRPKPLAESGRVRDGS